MAKSKVSEKLTSLANSAAGEDSSGKFMNPVKPTKSGKHRKNCICPECRGGRVDQDEPVSAGPINDPQANIDALKPVVKPVIDLISQAGVVIAEDPKAEMPPETAKILLDSACGCINQYLPSTMTSHANLIVFSLTFGNWAFGVYMLRRANLDKLIKEREERQKSSEAQGLRTEREVMSEVKVI